MYQYREIKKIRKGNSVADKYVEKRNRIEVKKIEIRPLHQVCWQCISNGFRKKN